MNQLQILEHKAQRVLTTAQIAEGYETTPEVISNNFNRNRIRYEEGKHFYSLEGEEKRAFCDRHQFDDGSKRAVKLYLWTEKGALLHAKSLNTDKAWEIYDYLVETYFNVKKSSATPQTYLEALKALVAAEEEKQSLQVTNSTLTVQNAIMAPKAEYFDELVDRHLLTNFRDTAKELGIQQSRFVAELIARKFIYRDGKGSLMPYAAKNNGLFEVKESINKRTEWAGVQTLVTPKGRETFRLLFAGL